METNELHTTRNALEETYRRQSRTNRGPYRRPHHPRQRRHADLASELGITDEALLDRVVALGLTPELVPAFESLPLVEVAWAGGNVEADERWRVLRGATRFGLELGRPAHAQLELWLSRRPSPEWFDAWCLVAAARQSRPESSSHDRRLLRESERVALASGGLLGFGAVSSAEREVLEQIARAIGLPDIASH